MPTTTSAELNVYSGENALVDFYDPDKCPPVPLVEVPKHPWRDQGVRIYAKLMSNLPAANVKSLPALNMLLRAKEEGKITKDTNTIIEYSSGSTVISLGILAHIMGIETVKHTFRTRHRHRSLSFLDFLGLICEYKPSYSAQSSDYHPQHSIPRHGQPEPLDPNGGIFAATRMARLRALTTRINILIRTHVRWTAPQIIRQLPDIKVFASSIGTSGTITGCGLALKKAKPDITRVGQVIHA
ncbi:cysteine synthase [Ceratobasidium sp. AG-Ba]|nr:cysteine synthase [Ceratobasidium sp. AG-Ba]